MNSVDVTQRFVELAVDPVSGTPEELRRFVAEQLEFHRTMVAKLGIKFD